MQGIYPGAAFQSPADLFDAVAVRVDGDDLKLPWLASLEDVGDKQLRAVHRLVDEDQLGWRRGIRYFVGIRQDGHGERVVVPRQQPFAFRFRRACGRQIRVEPCRLVEQPIELTTGVDILHLSFKDSRIERCGAVENTVLQLRRSPMRSF